MLEGQKSIRFPQQAYADSSIIYFQSNIELHKFTIFNAFYGDF